MGYLDLKPAPSTASKSAYVTPQNSNIIPSETTLRPKPSDSKNEKVKGGSLSNGSDPLLPSGPPRSVESQKQMDDENSAKGSVVKKSVPASGSKQPKQDILKNETKPKTVGRSDRDLHTTESKQGGPVHEPTPLTKLSTRSSLDAEAVGSKISESRNTCIKEDPSEVMDVQKRSSSRPSHSPRPDNTFVSKSYDKPTKRTSPAEEQDRFIKRRKGEHDLRDIDPEVRFLDQRAIEKHHSVEDDTVRSNDKLLDKPKNERYDREYRERFDKSHGDDVMEKSRDRSMERYSRERSVDKGKDDRSKDDRNKPRYNENPADDRFRGQSLPPPPPLPPHLVPQSLNASRREEDGDRRFGTGRHSQRLSPKHDDRERERRRSEENLLVSQEDAKRRREEEIRDRKREEREGLSAKVIRFYIKHYFPLRLISTFHP